ncbi:hypothetical protein A4R26_21125 [Niastella populi]|uniref:Uncharacterized protein n=2 Tax=Niastella populi TaxID=550983 RepID=A0A1V9FLU9_9BACT|nr:hypothetical protein A4R26_21125 [Niastella populi]
MSVNGSVTAPRTRGERSVNLTKLSSSLFRKLATGLQNRAGFTQLPVRVTVIVEKYFRNY